MTRNLKCESKTSQIECDTEYPDFWETTIIWGGTKRRVTECLAHAAASEASGKQVTLIDQR